MSDIEIKEGYKMPDINFKVNEEMEKKWQEEEQRRNIEYGTNRFLNSGFPVKYRDVNIMNLSEFQRKEGSEFLEKLLSKQRAGMWLCGAAGTGKTCLASAIAKELAIQNISVSYLKSHYIVSQLKKNQITIKQVINDIQYSRLIVIDEIGRYPEKEWESYYLFTILDELYDMNKSVIAISNLPKSDLGILLGLAAVDRFRGVTKTVEFTNMSYRGKANELYIN